MLAIPPRFAAWLGALLACGAPATAAADGLSGAFELPADTVSIEAGTVALGVLDIDEAVAGCRKSPATRCKPSRFDRETPAGSAKVSATVIDRREVSAGEYAACVAAGACEPWALDTCSVHDGDGWTTGGVAPHLDDARAPRTCVTRDDAASYCAWRGGHLPSESQWQAAVPDTTWPAGDVYVDAAYVDGGEPVVDVDEDLGHARPGLLHMGGNVYEWVADDACSYDALPTSGIRCAAHLATTRRA